MSTIAVIAGYAPSLVRFRGHLLKTIADMGHTVVALAPQIDPRTRRSLHDMGVQTQEFSLDRTGHSWFRDLRTVIQLRRAFAELRPDVVLSYTLKPVVYGAIAARSARVPTICSLITGLGYVFSGDSARQRTVQLLIRPLLRTAMKASHVVIFQNPDDVKLFRQQRLLGATTRVVQVNGSGVDVEEFNPVPLPSAGPVFLLVSRLLAAKGLRTYAEAARLVRSRFPHTRFLLVGPVDSGPDGVPLQEVKGWHKDGIVEYLGETDDVRPYIAMSTVFVLPSYYREGVPRSILEAMAMGRPIVTTDMPGCRETVEDGINGFLVPPRDPVALATALERFVVDTGLAARMGAESRRIAEQRFDVRLVTKAMLEAMGLLNRHSGTDGGWRTA